MTTPKRAPEKKRRKARKPNGTGGQRITLKQVAASLDLSPTTVSLVLNRAPGAASIPPETHRRVIAAAEELGYRPDFVARSLRSRRSLSIGVLVPEIGDAYASDVLSGIERRLLQDGYFYLIASHRSRSDLLKKHMQLLRDRLVEGFILVATPLDEPPGVPSVAIAGHDSLEHVTNVVLDHDRAATLALSHLADLGHERIALFKGPDHSADTEPRWQAILKAAAEMGLEIRPELTLQLGGDTGDEQLPAQRVYEEGYSLGNKLLRAGSPFTALFAFNDVSAIGAMRAFLDAGLEVPRQTSVVGFDDINAAAFQNPSLTTVHQPLDHMGDMAAKILLERLSGDAFDPENFVTIEPELVVRDSTGPAPRGRKTVRRAS